MENKTYELFNTQQAADYLSISQSALRKGRMRGAKTELPADHAYRTIPFIRLASQIRYVKADLDKWLEFQRFNARG